MLPTVIISLFGPLVALTSYTSSYGGLCSPAGFITSPGLGINPRCRMEIPLRPSSVWSDAHARSHETDTDRKARHRENRANIRHVCTHTHKHTRSFEYPGNNTQTPDTN